MAGCTGSWRLSANETRQAENIEFIRTPRTWNELKAGSGGGVGRGVDVVVSCQRIIQVMNA